MLYGMLGFYRQPAVVLIYSPEPYLIEHDITRVRVSAC